MRSTVQKFLAMAVRQQWLAMKIWTLLGYARLALIRQPLKTLLPASRVAGVSPAELCNARELGSLIERVADHTPWRSACLVQALVCVWMLDTRDTHYSFHLGTRWLGSSLDAHAWVSVQGEIICGEQVAACYQEIIQLDSDRSS